MGLNVRPHLYQTLNQIMKSYNPIVFAGSNRSYADSIIDYLDPEKNLFKYRLYRHNCVKLPSEKGTFYVKDLRIIKNVSLKNMVIIDNSVLSFAFQLENGIPISDFYNNKDDVDLITLGTYLMDMSDSDNLPAINSINFNLKDIIQENFHRPISANSSESANSAEPQAETKSRALFYEAIKKFKKGN